MRWLASQWWVMRVVMMHSDCMSVSVKLTVLSHSVSGVTRLPNPIEMLSPIIRTFMRPSVASGAGGVPQLVSPGAGGGGVLPPWAADEGSASTSSSSARRCSRIGSSGEKSAIAKQVPTGAPASRQVQ